MNRNWLVLGGASLVLAACVAPRTAPPDTPAPMPIESDSITYETGPCFGACPVYSVTVRPDGSGVFNGIRFTEVSGERAFQLTPAQYETFAAALAPYRPESGERRYEPGKPGCEMAATDMPSASIRWTRAIGDSQALHYYFGCDMDRNEAISQALGHAPELLPIEDLIGERP